MITLHAIVTTAPAIAALLSGNGKGAAAGSVLLNQHGGGPSTGLLGLFMFFVCMAIIVFAWLRLRGNRVS